MRIKYSNEGKVIDCPEEKLKFISFIDQLQNTKALHPITPERRNKQWVMDAWENSSQMCQESPQKTKYINKMIENYQNKSFRLKKIEMMSEQVQNTQKISTPLREKERKSTHQIQKENKEKEEVVKKPRSRLFSISKPTKKSVAVGEQQSGPFKVALGSVVYPMARQQPTQSRYNSQKGKRRIERFHSFVARTIRR